MGSLRQYEAHIIPRRPACDDRGWFTTVVASTVAEARRLAREEVRIHCVYDRLDGALVVTVWRDEE